MKIAFRLLVALVGLSLGGLLGPLNVAAETLQDRVLLHHLQGLPSAEAELTQALRQHTTHESKAIAQPAKQALRLLALPKTQKFPVESLMGAWKVRSIQASDLGVFSYAFFDCSFDSLNNGVIRFIKNKGSQRRSGLVSKAADGTVFFIGSSYIAGDPVSQYSNFAPQDEADPDRDSVGNVYRISANHILMVFLSTSYGFEMYELKRKS